MPATIRGRRKTTGAVVEPPAAVVVEQPAPQTTPQPAAEPARPARKTAAARPAAKPATTARAAAKKAPARAGTRPARGTRPAQAAQDEPAAPAGDATTAEAGARPGGTQEKDAQIAEIAFQGRQVKVKLPTFEQLTIFKRTADRFASIRDSDQQITGPEATRLYDRALRVITALLVDRDQVEWIEDLLLDGTVELADCTPLITEAVGALREANTSAGNREQRRSAARLGR